MWFEVKTPAGNDNTGQIQLSTFGHDALVWLQWLAQGSSAKKLALPLCGITGHGWELHFLAVPDEEDISFLLCCETLSLLTMFWN